eukprot:1003721-Rhodomonas_salina.2
MHGPETDEGWAARIQKKLGQQNAKTAKKPDSASQSRAREGADFATAQDDEAVCAQRQKTAQHEAATATKGPSTAFPHYIEPTQH